MKTIRGLLAAAIAVSFLAAFVQGHEMPYTGQGPTGPNCVGEDSVTYVGASTVVTRDASTGTTVVDEDTVLACDPSGTATQGGGFVPFGSGNAIEVVDDVAGHDVAFQVCIDNDGDGDCHKPAAGDLCGDDIYFSHGDDGTFHNPLGPLPTGFASGSGCPPRHPFSGYVVFVCEGVHADGAASHEHSATKGTIVATTGGTLGGDFCGGPPPPVHSGPGVKRYLAPSTGGPLSESFDCGIGNNAFFNMSFGGVCFGSLPEHGWGNGNEGFTDEFGNPAGSARLQHLTYGPTEDVPTLDEAAAIDITDSSGFDVPATYCQDLDGDGVCGGGLATDPVDPAVDFCDSITIYGGLTGPGAPRARGVNPGTAGSGDWADPTLDNWAIDYDVYIFVTSGANGNPPLGSVCGLSPTYGTEGFVVHS